MQALAVAQRVVPADGDERIDAQVLQVVQDVRREVARALVVRLGVQVLRVAEEIRDVLGADVARFGAAGVEKRAAGAVHRPDALLVERDQVPVETLRIVRVELQEPAPAAPNADNFVAFFDGAVHDGFDAGVEAGDVAAAGKNTDLHASAVWLGETYHV